MNKIVKYSRIKSIFPYRVFPVYQQQNKNIENTKKIKEHLVKKENIDKDYRKGNCI